MSTDRELLQLAAKAIGGRPYVDRAWPGLCLSDDPECGPFSVNEDGNAAIAWNPLEYDGDALRLAASLELGLVFCREEVSVMGVDDTSLEYFDEPYGNDRMAATRRAIVRAAADIGRSMP